MTISLLFTGERVRKHGGQSSTRLTPIDAWLTAVRDSLARRADLGPTDLTVDDHTATIVLDLARIAAHTSGQRANAPLLSYLVGLAVGQGANIDDLKAAIHEQD